jgi:hypothetical protein
MCTIRHFFTSGWNLKQWRALTDACNCGRQGAGHLNSWMLQEIARSARKGPRGQPLSNQVWQTAGIEL